MLINESGPWAQAAITEGLCRSLYDGIIRVFSAPPLSQGGTPGPARFGGIRTVNAFLVASEQVPDSKGQMSVSFIGIQSLAGAVCRVALPDWEEVKVDRVDPLGGGVLEPIQAAIEEGVVTFSTVENETYLLYPAARRPPRLWSECWKDRPPPWRQYIGLPQRRETSRPTQGAW